MSRVRIGLDRPVKNSKVFIDDQDVSSICQAVDVHGEIGKPATVTLRMVSHEVEITGMGDVYRRYAPCGCPRCSGDGIDGPGETCAKCGGTGSG